LKTEFGEERKMGIQEPVVLKHEGLKPAGGSPTFHLPDLAKNVRRLAIVLPVLVFVALAVRRVNSWGAPVHVGYKVAVSSGVPDVARNWTIIREDGGRETWTARDENGDGTWDAFTTPEGSFLRPTRSPKRWLVVCLDGVPFSVIQDLWESGHFRELFRPSATVSTFPSDTELALTTAMHAAPVPGYEHHYFDRDANRMRGGGWVTMTGYHIPYIRMFDYDPPGWSKVAPYVRMQKSYDADLGRFRAAFLGSRSKVFFAHITASDAFLHARTAREATPSLIEFDDVLRDLYLNAHGELGILVFSDHGNTQVPERPAPLAKFLQGYGWRVRDTVQASRDVAIPPYGLVGFAAVYCRPESVETLAEQLRGVEGADLIVSRGRDANSATIREAGSIAIARLQWTVDGRWYRYSPEGGDPLKLADIVNHLRASGKAESDGFVSDADLFNATSTSYFPDAAARIRHWARGGGIRNPSDIMVSFRPGYFYGEGAFEHIVTLAGTHGGMERSASLGFAMATFPLPRANRIEDLIPIDLRNRSISTGIGGE
jgi:hypothetical protein